MRRTIDVVHYLRGKMCKWAVDALIVGTIFIAPLAPSTESLTQVSPYIAALLWWVVLVSQPSLGPREMAGNKGDALSAVLIALGALVSQCIAVVNFALQMPESPPAVSGVVAGALMGVAGLALRLWAIATLGEFFSATVKVSSDHRIATLGPYRTLRHPSYTGSLLIWVGVPLLLGSTWGVIVALVLGIAAYAWRIHVEEKALTQSMGPEYAAYSLRTWRLVPFIL